MRVSRAFVVLFFVVLALALVERPLPAASAAGRFVAGQVIVQFQPGASASAVADAHRQAGATVLATEPRTGLQLVGVAGGQESAAIARYERNPSVRYAEPNFVRDVPEPTAHAAGAEIVPSDFYFDEEWGLHNTGQMFECIMLISSELCFYIGTADADIDAPEAWAISTGAGVRVAVIDTGVDFTHPDLAAAYAGGWDYIFNDNDPQDDQGHGTHVAGTIAARMSNLTGDPAKDEGVVGVAPNARILAYKVCRSDGTCDDFSIVQAIDRAVADGAKVINMSFGGPAFSQSMYDAVQRAWNAGLVIVGGAGNDGSTALFYPAAFDNVISVGAFDEDDRRASFSNYGSWVDISAPGNVIMSTYPMYNCSPYNAVPGDTGCYTWLSGTSMATPHVSGAAALVWSRTDVATNAQVRDIILNSAEPRGVDVVRLDSWTIHGGLNLHNAMSYVVTNQPPVANAGPDQTVADSDSSGSETVSLNGNASSDPDGSIVSYEWREGGAFVASGATPSISLTVGAHTLTLTVTDNGGATASDNVVITVLASTPAPDTVVITKANWNSRSRQLTVEATSTAAPTAVLTLYDNTDPANPVLIGTLSYNVRKGKYTGTWKLTSTPASVLVTSSAGGSATSAVAVGKG